MNSAKTPVSILHYACAPIIGGVEGIMADHRALLARQGHPVQLIAGRGAPDVLLPALDSRDEAVLAVQQELDAGRVPSGFAPLRDEIRDRLAAVLGAFGGALIVHNAFTLHKNLPLTAALWELAALGDRRYIAWCHDLAWTNPYYLPTLHPGYPWDLLRRPAPGVSYVAISHERQIELAGLFGWPVERVVRVPNGIAAEKMLPTGLDLRLLADHLDFAGRDLILLAPVRMTRRKNLELAIRAVAVLKERGLRPLLLITGPPGPHNPKQDYADFLYDERERLGLLDEVSFLSRLDVLPQGVSDDLMRELYHWSDALLFTSAQEGFGLPVLEAGLARLPIFCSDLPVLREAGGDDAHYFSPDAAPEQVAALLTGELGQPGAARLRRRVLQSYDWPAIYERGLRPLIEDV